MRFGIGKLSRRAGQLSHFDIQLRFQPPHLAHVAPIKPAIGPKLAERGAAQLIGFLMSVKTALDLR
jgi:hypothetical protein